MLGGSNLVGCQVRLPISFRDYGLVSTTSKTPGICLQLGVGALTDLMQGLHSRDKGLWFRF